MNALELLAETACSHDYAACQGRCIKECYHCKCFERPCECPCECDLEMCECMCYCECTCTEHKNCTHMCLETGKCAMSLCDNFFLCKAKMPEHQKIALGGTCVWCKVNIGRVKDSKLMEECGVCLDMNKTLILQCGHRLCYKCHIEWKQLNDTCPFCRAQI